MSFNRVILMGNVGRDPEVNDRGNGKVGTISLATTRRYKDTNGERQEETEWHQVTVFGHQAEFTERYVKKGAMLLIEGRLRTRKWQTEDGQQRSRTEIICESIQFAGKPVSTGTTEEARKEYRQQAPRQSAYQANAAHRPMPINNGIGEMDEDIPF